jgi:hypothetical protein
MGGTAVEPAEAGDAGTSHTLRGIAMAVAEIGSRREERGVREFRKLTSSGSRDGRAREAQKLRMQAAEREKEGGDLVGRGMKRSDGLRFRGWTVGSADVGRKLGERATQLASHLNSGQMVTANEFGMALREGRAEREGQ